MILDIHTHHPLPQPQAVVAFSPAEFEAVRASLPEGQSCSVGIHPWSLASGLPDAATRAALERAAENPAVVAIGECGVDLVRGGALFAQLNVLKWHIELSERLSKPLVLHCVRAHDHIIALRRDMKPAQPWAIHGFRGKPSIARMLLDAGCWLSLGSLFNADSAAMIPADRLLAETDEAPVAIGQVIESIANARAVPPADQQSLIAANTARFLSL